MQAGRQTTRQITLTRTVASRAILSAEKNQGKLLYMCMVSVNVGIDCELVELVSLSLSHCHAKATLQFTLRQNNAKHLKKKIKE